MQKRYFKKGMTVYSSKHGEGVVAEITDNNYFPIKVNFNNTDIGIYKEDGRVTNNELITLSQNPIPPIVNKPFYEFENGDLVWVKNIIDESWEARYFSKMNGDGRYRTYNNQAKYGATTVWDECVPFDERPF